MLPVYVAAFELLIVLLFGVFFRLETSTLDNLSSLTGTLVFLAGFAFISVSRKSLSWTSLGNLVVLLAICMQWTLLWTAFWNSCFLGFNTTYTLTIADLIQCSQCTLCLLLVTTDFLGKIHHSQLVYLSLLLSIGFSLNASIFAYGLKIYDSGAGMQVFLFSSVFFIVAWVCAMLRKKLEVTKQVFWYHGQSIGMVGVLLVVYSWGSWNMAGAVFTAKNSVEGLNQLQTSAFMNTIFGMASSIVFSMLLMTPHYKAPITYNIDAIINGGIIISSLTDLLLNPVTPIILSGFASTCTIGIHKYFSDKTFITYFSQPLLRGVFGILACIFASIAIAARQGQTPILADNLSRIAGMEFAGLVVTIGIAGVFGVVGGAILVFTEGPGREEVGRDVAFWVGEQEDAMPIVVGNTRDQKTHEQVRNAIEDTSRLQNHLLDDTKQAQHALPIRSVSSRGVQSENSQKPAVEGQQLNSIIIKLPLQSLIKPRQMDRDALEAAVRPKRPTNLSLNQNLHFVEVDNMLADTPKQQVARKLTFNSADEGSVAQEIHVSRIN